MTKISDWMDVEKIQALNCSNIEKDAIFERNAPRLPMVL
jgi:hypothetical protein